MTAGGLGPLLAVVAPLADAFTEAGYHSYLVGGIVRDHLLGIDPGEDTDLDLTTDARPDQTKVVVARLADAVWTQGERFGTIGARINGRVFEITTHRAERYDPSSRRPQVEFSDAIESDLSRRDFTVNAMALRLPSGELIDPFDGRADLVAGILRTPIAAASSFNDDPLRMLRAARFVATHGLRAVPELTEAMGRLTDRLAIVSAERIRDELLRLLGAGDPASGLRLVVDTGLAGEFLPELTDSAVALLSAAGLDPFTRLVALLYPDDRADRLGALRFSNADQARAQRMLRAVGALGGRDPEALRRFVVTARPDVGPAVSLAGAVGVDPSAGLARLIDELVVSEGADGFAPPLDGRQVMELLGLEPGPLVGEAVDMLGRRRLADGPMTEAEAEATLRSWWAERA